MIRGHGRGPGSLGSRSGVSYMPPIDENEVASTPSPSPPKTPLRVPHKSPRRGMRTHNGVTKINSNNNGAAKLNGVLPPPYVPPYILSAGYSPPHAPTLHPPPPSYKEAHAVKGKIVEGESLGEEEGVVPRGRICGVDRRRVCCLFGVAVAAMAIIAIGLGIGLTIGLKDKRQGSTEDNSPLKDPNFPAGSFSFKANLQKPLTECTSNPSTWRCYPYTEGEPATFFWIITYVNTQFYKISSTDNPFAPSFTNLTLELLDENTPKERLLFSFSMNKTVVPDDQLSSSNRAARCTFDDTRFEATLWTHRSKGHDNDDDTSENSKFVAWPGDVEIVQSKSFKSGSPRCVDDDGDKVGDVKSRSGACECRYTNFDTD
ncbi:hypothetical protein B0J15DRAFT_44716 [Fusarium solani]|uniref:Uncharacterized protein n=1 Tax=Fusarium solani TaxID=169388 RepID=A0A9P9H5M1_FUSSL|nr:uncharacterized protein B0J15DRAFT_44716 [Fusarium solani]KAH7250539.1 hypothetical protein B0J15DRAFT_44716 [Fusarium solani]